MHLPRPRPLRTDAAAAVGPPGSRRLALSVVVVAGGDGEQLATCLKALEGAERRGVDIEPIVVDRTGAPSVAQVAATHGARLIPHAGSRGACFAVGAKAATAEWLLLLRAETVLGRGWDATVMVFSANDRNRERGAVFPLEIIGEPAATRCIRVRNKWMTLTSGAQAMFLRRRFLVHLGGIADLERGEDLVLARTLGLKRLAMFDIPATVAGRDWPTGAGAIIRGVIRILLFRLGVPARWLQGSGD